MKEEKGKQQTQEQSDKVKEENRILKEELNRREWKEKLQDKTEANYQTLLLLSQIKDELGVISHNLSEYFKSKAKESDDDDLDDEEPDEESEDK